MNSTGIPITRRGLAKVLREHGMDLKPRTVESWQKKELLPPFDSNGRGFGKGKGRAEGAWADGELIVKQAICIRNLLSAYGSAERAYTAYNAWV